MSDEVQFHLDENVSNAIAEGLRRRGTTAEAGLLSATDEEQLAYAHAQSPVLVTLDDDLLKLHAAGSPHAGIAYCKQGTKSFGAMLRALITIYEAVSAREVSGWVLFL